MIQQPNEKIESKKHIIIIAGVPGIGKTTLALSAPNPLLINTDDGYDKINPVHRIAPHITPKSYEEIVNDLKKEDLSGFDTLVFDTGGTLINYIKAYAAKQNINTQKDGITLSMKGYGFVKTQFEALTNYCRYELKKHIVLIFHTVEKQEDDKIIYRLDVEGSSDRISWKIADLGGFMHSQGNKRIINFSPTEYNHAKSAYGVVGIREIPETKSASDNLFLTNLFQEAAKYKNKLIEMQDQYIKLMDHVRELISGVIDATTANDLYTKFKDFNWLFASKREAWKLLTDHAATIKVKYDKKTFKFVGVE